MITDAGRAALTCVSSPAAAAPLQEGNASNVAVPDAPRGKLGLLVGLLRQEAGATIAQMTEATGWQAHSVRGAIAGSLKRFNVTSALTDGVRIYRVTA